MITRINHGFLIALSTMLLVSLVACIHTARAPKQSYNYIIGADISSAAEQINNGAIYIDTDGKKKHLLDLLQNHGFNYIRLRTFVNPGAAYGYASNDNCPGKSEFYNDKEHVIAFAKEVKLRGMGLLLDFHYSDTWADPQKQVIPEAWRNTQSIKELASKVQSYTTDVVEALINANARPDMVQVGNEITPGMMIHIPTNKTNCYGNDSMETTQHNGSTQNWDNLAQLLKAGISGVKAADSTIKIMLHIENTGDPMGISKWVQNAQSRNVQFDVLGLSAYEKWQGPSSLWQDTLNNLSIEFPALEFSIVEYNPQRKLLNNIMYKLNDNRGLGTFFWEPVLSGVWGESMFTKQGNVYTAKSNDFALYDEINADYNR